MTPAQEAGRRRAWPRWLRRGVLESVATLVIAAGVLMLLQPVSLVLYSYSFVTTLAGVAMFAIVSKFPE
jgi:Ca2+/H+ antiporter